MNKWRKVKAAGTSGQRTASSLTSQHGVTSAETWKPVAASSLVSNGALPAAYKSPSTKEHGVGARQGQGGRDAYPTRTTTSSDRSGARRVEWGTSHATGSTLVDTLQPSSARR
jgi:hypothetical protein